MKTKSDLIKIIADLLAHAQPLDTKIVWRAIGRIQEPLVITVKNAKYHAIQAAHDAVEEAAKEGVERE